MSEQNTPDQQQPVQKPSNGISSAALASSVPDDNHILMRMLKMLFRMEDVSPWVGWIGMILGGFIMLVYVIAKWGVPAILALQTLILQMHGDNLKLETADREAQRDLAKEQVQVNKALLDGVAKIDSKVGQISVKVDEQGQSIDRLSADVAGLKRDQVGYSQRLNSVANQQQDLQRRIEQQPRH